MAPRGLKDSTEANGNAHSGENGKGKAKISQNSSNASLRDLTPETVDKGIASLRQLFKILHFVQGYREEISDVESIYDLGITQHAQIEELETTVANLAFRKDQEMAKLRTENDAYKATARQIKREREELKLEKASMDDKRHAMQSKMERQKNLEIEKAKQDFSDDCETTVNEVREELGKKIQNLEKSKSGLKDAMEKLEKKNIQVQEDLNQQKKSLELDKRSSQSHIMRLELELHQIKAASTVSPQTPEFYIEGFHKLWQGIQDVAINDLKFLPEDTNQLDSDEVRDRLFSASAIFKYPPLSTASPVAIFLRACAIQNFLSTKFISIIRRRYFAESTAAVERKSGTQPMDSILDTISNVPAVTACQELSWQLTTVDKLDRLSSHGPSAKVDVFTEPSQNGIVDEILDLLHYFQDPTNQRQRAKLMGITSMAIKLWSALRKDSCQVDFDYDPSTHGWEKWDYVDEVTTNGQAAANSPDEIPMAMLPSKSFVLFPRVTGLFSPDRASLHTLQTGSALPHDSPAFRMGLQEIKHIDHVTKEFQRSLRRGSGVQSSPVMGKHQGDWPALHRGSN